MANAQEEWVWINDKTECFVSGYIINKTATSATVRIESGEERNVNLSDIVEMNPQKFDKAEDMADLTHLNEASVIHNLRSRYKSDLIYTYSGLFLVFVNPYKKLPLYKENIILAYRGKKRVDLPPHIFAISDKAYHDMLNTGESQSLLITGESGAGKTENTKKVIQYLTTITKAATSGSKNAGSLEQQILNANPILESFGNAQTIRNNNSSRFGKFIRIEFNNYGQIMGAFIQHYLFEKSRVTHQGENERSYHVFYQLIRGADEDLKKKLFLTDDISQYGFIRKSNMDIFGVDDGKSFTQLREALTIMDFSSEEQNDLFSVVAATLHLGNLQFEAERTDQARMISSSQQALDSVCKILGVQSAEFLRCILKPKIKAGRDDWVTQSRNVDQVNDSVEVVARSLYERMFGKLVDRINQSIYSHKPNGTFIGVLDIAGFEIFQLNSFEQLCINYTNEKLQQFFNHYMFVLEQEEYKREAIDWNFIDFGLDLQPTIDLIEKTSPIGILHLLDEECVIPKGSDTTFLGKLNGLWNNKSDKYEIPRFNNGFILQHYAGKVEYNTDGWLDKNKDPLNDNVTRLLAKSSNEFIASLFADYLNEDSKSPLKGIMSSRPLSVSDYVSDSESKSHSRTPSNTKKGAFRTAAQRHIEQLSALMAHLNSTKPHFVRCIIPNDGKKAGFFDAKLILEQLRCNGVLEGIRICRSGFPNRLTFADFRKRYELLVKLPNGHHTDARKAANLLLEALQLDKDLFRIGKTKIFFRAKILADLETRRDIKITGLVIKIQAIIRGYLARRSFVKRIEKSAAIEIIQYNARIFLELKKSMWWKLFSSVKPLINVHRADESMNNLKKQLIEERKKNEAQIKEFSKITESSKTLQHRIDQLNKELERTNERNLYLESLNHEMESIIKERESDILRLTGYLDRFCTLFTSLAPDVQSQTKEGSGI